MIFQIATALPLATIVLWQINSIGKRGSSHLFVCMHASWIGLNSFWAHFWNIHFQLKSTQNNPDDRELVRCGVDEEDFNFDLKTDNYGCVSSTTSALLVDCTFLNVVLFWFDPNSLCRFGNFIQAGRGETDLFISFWTTTLTLLFTEWCKFSKSTPNGKLATTFEGKFTESCREFHWFWVFLSCCIYFVSCHFVHGERPSFILLPLQTINEQYDWME